jgi:hypothetical protein
MSRSLSAWASLRPKFSLVITATRSSSGTTKTLFPPLPRVKLAEFQEVATAEAEAAAGLGVTER